MTLFALCSFKASPGVTTTSLAMAATWPGNRRVLVAELDAAGGDLAARFGLKQQPGLISLAAVGRREQSADVVFDHCQRLGDALSVLVGPPSGEHARSALSRGTSSLQALAAHGDVDVLADLGRIDPLSPNWSLASAAAIAIVCVRPMLSELQHVAGALKSLQEAGASVVVALVGDGHYQASEVAEALKVDVLGVIPQDAAAVSNLNSGGASLAKLGRSQLFRAAHDLALACCGPMQPALVFSANENEENDQNELNDQEENEVNGKSKLIAAQSVATTPAEMTASPRI